MIYHCEDHTCNYWDEGEKLPERCPQCGRKLLRANEADALLELVRQAKVELVYAREPASIGVLGKE